MGENNVVEFAGREAGTDPLTEMLIASALQLICQVEADAGRSPAPPCRRDPVGQEASLRMDLLRYLDATACCVA